MRTINQPKTLFLDTETTGLHPPTHSLVEIAMVDEYGDTVLDTLVNPLQPIGEAQKIHGITDEMVTSAPTLDDLWPGIEALMMGSHVIIYNKEFDIKFFPQSLSVAKKISCCMERFAKVYGERYSHYGSYKRQSLSKAMHHIGAEWSGKAHRALVDAKACRNVWVWLEAQS